MTRALSIIQAVFRPLKKASRAVLIFVVLSIVVPVTVFVVGADSSYTSHFARAHQQLNQSLEVILRHTARWFQNIRGVEVEASTNLLNLSDEQIRAGGAALQERVRHGMLGSIEEAEDVWVLDTNGNVLLAANHYPKPEYLSWFDKDYYRKRWDPVPEATEPNVNELLTSREGNHRLLLFIWPRKNERGGYAGVTAVVVHPEYFQDFLSGLLNDSVTSTMLVRNDGAVLAHTPGAALDLSSSNPNSHFAMEFAENPEHGSFQAMPPGGTGAPQFIEYTRVPGYPVYLAAGLNVSAVVAAWKDDLLGELSVGGPLLLGLLGFGAVALHFTWRENAALASLRKEVRRREELEERFQQFAEKSSVIIWIANADEMRFDYLSPAFEEVWGASRGEALNQPRKWGRCIIPEDRSRVFKALAGLRRGQPYTMEYRIVQPSTGSLKWIRDIGFRVTHGRIGGIATDITDAKLAEGKIRLLSQEVSHRAKNMLAVVQSVARQTAAESDPGVFAEHFTQRIAGLAASLDLLVKSGWQGVSLRDLARSQLAPFIDLSGGQVILEGPSLMVRPAAAQTLGMAVHELATNSIKYGALSNAQGQVSIRWRIMDDRLGTSFRITWTEQGGPEPKAPSHHGFGYTVVVSVAEYSLSAKVQLQYPSTGLVWELVAPLEEILELEDARRTSSMRTAQSAAKNEAIA